MTQHYYSNTPVSQLGSQCAQLLCTNYVWFKDSCVRGRADRPDHEHSTTVPTIRR